MKRPEGSRTKAFWRAWLKRWRKSHPLPPPPKPKPKPKPPKPPAAPPPSWTIPGPIVLTASDPDAALDPATGKPRDGVNAIGRIVVPGEAPLWRVDSAAGRTGWIAQIEGLGQLSTAYALLQDKPISDSRAVIGTGNVAAQPLIDIGVTSYFIELNAQSSWEPYGNAERMKFQAHQDGWPHVRLSYGVYTPVPLAAYGAYVPQVWSSEMGRFVPGTEPQGLEKDCCIFSAEGCGDTGSWPTVAKM